MPPRYEGKPTPALVRAVWLAAVEDVVVELVS